VSKAGPKSRLLLAAEGAACWLEIFAGALLSINSPVAPATKARKANAEYRMVSSTRIRDVKEQTKGGHSPKQC
jgi:hypothetical protein